MLVRPTLRSHQAKSEMRSWHRGYYYCVLTSTGLEVFSAKGHTGLVP